MQEFHPIESNRQEPVEPAIRSSWRCILEPIKSMARISLLRESATGFLFLGQLDKPLSLLGRFSKTMLSTLAQLARTFLGLPPPRKKTLLVSVVNGFLKRQWLVVIACGTVVVPTAFYLASILEGVAFVEYTRLATLSWLSFFAGAVLNRLRK